MKNHATLDWRYAGYRLDARRHMKNILLLNCIKKGKPSMVAIKNFDEQAAVNFISNTFNNNSHDSSTFNALNLNPTFNLIL